MSNSINTILICGNITKDAEVRSLSDGTKVATLNVATSEGGYKSKDGRDIPEVTQFHRVVAWRGLANLVEKAGKKGVRVCVEGKMTYRTWFDDEANKAGRHDIAEIVADTIVVCGSGLKDEEKPEGVQEATEASPAKSDDLPF